MSPVTQNNGGSYFSNPNSGSKSAGRVGLTFNSPATSKSKKALDRLPKNLIHKSGQERMVN